MLVYQRVPLRVCDTAHLNYLNLVGRCLFVHVSICLSNRFNPPSLGISHLLFGNDVTRKY